MTKEEAFSLFMTINQEYLRPNTLRTYRYAIKDMLCLFPDIVNVEEFTWKHIHKFFNHLSEVTYVKGKDTEPKKLSKMAKRVKYFAIDTFFSTMVDARKIKRNPMRKIFLPKEEQRLMSIVTFEDLYKLREVSKDNLRDRMVIETLWYTGVRVDELCHIKMDEVHMGDRYIDIPMSKNLLARSVLFSQYCKKWLEDYIKWREEFLISKGNSTPYLFLNAHGRPLTTQGVWFIIKKYCDIAGINKDISPHSFRRSFASLLHREGVPIEHIMRLMGHLDVKTTYRYIVYADLLET